MRNLKRVLSLALALVMVLGMMVIGTSAATFTDAEEITYTEAVDVMSALGILKGYENADGSYTFKPEGTLNRQEAAKILAFVCMGTEADEYLTGSGKSFNDVDADHWAAKYIAYCKNLGIINGVNDAQTLFNPTGTLTTVQFAKMLLVAIEVDGTFTGEGWEENVKKAVAKVGTMAATGIKIDNSDITREEACELALAAMKHGETYSNGYYYEGKVEEYGYAATYSEMFIMAKTMEDTNFVATKIKKHSDVRDTLLEDVYKVTYTPDNDAFGRPGTTYVVGEDELFFVDAPVVTFKNTAVVEKNLAAALGAKKDETVTITVITEDGVAWEGVSSSQPSADGDGTYLTPGATLTLTNGQNNKHALPGFGKGITVEIYATATEGEYEMVAIREYLGTVKKVNPADPEVPTSKRTIDIELNKVPAGNETTKVLTGFVTEDFAEKDVVVVTVAAGKVQAAALAKTITGTATKAANGVYTISGAEYVMSQNSTATVTLNGKEASWYVDSFGNLLANVGAPEDPETVYYYGLFKGAEGLLYKEAGADSLLTAGDGAKEAKEVIQILTSENKLVVYETAWKYIKNDDGEITKVDFINAVDQTDLAPADVKSYSATLNATNDADKLVKYTLDENGKIATIELAGNTRHNAVSGKLTTGVPQLVKTNGTPFATGLLTDETVFFLKVDDDNAQTTDKFVAYTGYKNVPKMTFTGVSYFLTEENEEGAKVYTHVVISGNAVQGQAPATKDNYVYFGSVAPYTEWDATANDGKGAMVYVYDNLYINGVKSAEAWKFTTALTGVKAGEMYKYSVNDKGVISITKTDVLSNTKVTSNQGDYFMAGKVYYVDDTTVFYQIDAARKTITEVEGLPALKENSVIINFVGTPAQDSTITPVVYFSVLKVGETAAGSVAEIEAAKAGETVVLSAGIEDVDSTIDLKGKNLDGNGKTITTEAEFVANNAGRLATVIETTGGKISNIKIDGGRYGIVVNERSVGGKMTADLVLSNVEVINCERSININNTDDSNSAYKLIATDCKFSGKPGWDATVISSAFFTRCEFVAGGTKHEMDPRTDTTFTDCTFEDGYVLNFGDLSAGKTVKMINCTYQGQTVNGIFDDAGNFTPAE